MHPIIYSPKTPKLSVGTPRACMHACSTHALYRFQQSLYADTKIALWPAAKLNAVGPTAPQTWGTLLS